jgi:hypothetical protein
LAIPADRQLSFTVLATPVVDGQDPVQDFAQDEIKSQQQLIAELKFLRRENAALKAENAAHKGEVQVSTRIIQIEKERGDFFKDAAAKGITVGSNSLALEVKYQEQINNYKDENGRLRDENKDLRSSRNTRTFLGFLGGAGVCYAATRR